MFGGFGRSNSNNAGNDVVVVLNPGQVNYAKQALAVKYLNDMLSEEETKHHFLYKYAIARSTSEKNTLAHHLELVHRYLRNPKNAHKDYHKCLALAFVNMKGVIIPVEETENENFLLHFTELVKSKGSAAQIANYEIIAAQYDELRELMQNIVYEMNLAETDKITKVYYKFCETIVENGIPSEEKVRQTFGERAAQLYHNDLDMIESDQVKFDLDIDEALQNGLNKRWTDAKQMERCVNMVRIYSETLPMVEIQDAALHCEEWLQRNNPKNDPLYLQRKQVAQQFGVWRVRKNEMPAWRACFEERYQDFDLYVQLEQRLRRECAQGVYLHVQRRHISANSVHEMFAINFPRYKELFNII